MNHRCLLKYFDDVLESLNWVETHHFVLVNALLNHLVVEQIIHDAEKQVYLRDHDQYDLAKIEKKNIWRSEFSNR